MTATELLIWGVVVHLVVDWLLQDEWIAENKCHLRHPAGWLHATVHGLAMLLVFPVAAAAALGLAHLVIDTRRPLQWWGRLVSQPQDGAVGFTVHVWRDQTLHIAVIAVVALIVG